MRKTFGTTALLACALTLLLASSDAEASSLGRLHRERLEVGRALIEAQSSNWQAILPYYTADIEYHDPVVDIYGIDMMTEFLGRLFTSSGDLITTIEDETLLNGVYSASWTMVGQFNGVPYSAKGISIIKFRGLSKRVYYQRDYYSENDIMINIPGLDQAAIGFRTYYRCAVDPTFECPLEAGATTIKPTDNLPSADKSWNSIVSAIRLRRERLEIGRALIEINNADWQSLLPYYTNDIEYHDPIVDIYGIDTLVPFLGRLFASSGDLITTVEDESLVDGVYTATWTMAGLFNGIPYSAKGMSILKFRAGSAKAYYSRDYYTEGDIMATVPGLDQAIGGFRTYYRCAVDPTFTCPLPPTGTLEAGNGKSDGPQSASAFSLRQNAPNPFNPTTEISFVVPDGGANVSLRVYDITGRLVRTLVEGNEPAGTRSVTWSGENDRGQPVPSGTYFYHLTGPSFSEKKKMVLLK
ncbi:MAG: nuclear transport factor 2 family protein [bacterium]|nr:nuclear transport factor 2 family protein [bacterium]